MNIAKLRLTLLLSGALVLSMTATAAAQDDGSTEADEAAPAEAPEAEAPEGEEAPEAAEEAPAEQASTDETADETAPDETAADETAADELEAPVESAATEPSETVAETEPAETATELASPDESALDEGDLEDEAGADEAAEEAPASSGPAPLPWRSTFFNWTNGVTFNSFIRDSQLSYNPIYRQRFSLSPRWYVAPTSFFWANVALDLEITDDDSGALNREPQFFDTAFEFRHMMPIEGFIFIGQMRVELPTSKSSQAAQRYFLTGLGLTAVRAIPEIGLTIAALTAYRRWWSGSNVVRTGEPLPDNCAPYQAPGTAGGMSAPNVNTTTCDQLGSTSAARDIFLGGVALTWVPFAGFNISASGFIFTTYGYELAPAVIGSDQVITRPEDQPLVIEDGSRSHWNNFTFVSLAVGYQFFPWLNVSMGIQNSIFLASAWAPDGSLRNPIASPDTQVFLQATFTVDEIYNTLFGPGESDLTPEERQRRQQGLASGPSVGGSF